MILLALSLQIVYAPPARSFEAHAKRCDLAEQHLRNFVGQTQSFVSNHETDSGGTLSSDEGVGLRAVVDTIARPYFSQIEELREDPSQADCEVVVEAAKDEITNRFIAPTFAPSYGYHYRNGRWKRR